ncbi:MAG: hypothetical protein JWM11_3894 [Planctomycetaceae bacterium]|nr:hypothetical protein [Planctomycetaceae bacterium]
MVSDSLKRLITEVRDSLVAIDNERSTAQRHALFELEFMELEIKFTVADSGTQKGGIDLKIVSLGTEGTIRSEEVQTLRLKYRVAPHTANDPLPGTRFHGEQAGGKGSRETDTIE